MNLLLPITLLAPFAGILALIVTPEDRRGLARAVALLASAVALVGAIALAVLYDRGAADVRFPWSIPWLPQLGVTLAFGLDALSLPLLVMSAVLGFTAVLVTDVKDRDKLFYILLLATVGSGLAAFASRNLLIFYFLCEMTTVPKYLLTAAWGELPEGKYRVTPPYAAMQVTLFIAAGAMAVLLGLASLYLFAGSLDFNALHARALGAPISGTAQYWIYGAFLLGFGIWTSMWPFHTWSPLTYAAAPPPAAMLFSGILKNFGAYGLLRLGSSFLPDGAHDWSQPLAVIGIINILYGGFAAMRQKDWCYIVAYSSISHVGYLFLALAAGGRLGTTAAIFFMVAHGLVVGLLFAVTGFLYRGAGSRHVPELGGLARSMPFVSVAAAVGAIAASGLPGFANFFAEVMVFVAAWTTGRPLFVVGAVVAVWGVVMTATYFFRALRNTFYGESKGATPPPRPRTAAILAVAILVLSSAALGLWPRFVTDLFSQKPLEIAAPAETPQPQLAEAQAPGDRP